MTEYNYATEEITVTVRYRIKWNAGDDRAREDAVSTALSLCRRGGGAGIYGCYGAERISEPHAGLSHE